MRRLAIVIALVLPGAATPITYDYDEAGRLIRATHAEAVISYEYDDAGNLVRRVIDTDLDTLLMDGFEGD